MFWFFTKQVLFYFQFHFLSFFRFFTDAVEKNLSQSMGGDLLSLNIQRDRNNALPSYNAFRHNCGLGELDVSFFELRREISVPITYT